MLICQRGPCARFSIRKKSTIFLQSHSSGTVHLPLQNRFQPICTQRVLERVGVSMHMYKHPAAYASKSAEATALKVANGLHNYSNHHLQCYNTMVKLCPACLKYGVDYAVFARRNARMPLYTQYCQAGDTRIPLPRKLLGHPQKIVDCKVGLCISLRTVAEFL